MKSKATILKNGNIQYYSRMFDLYFVTEKQEYSYKETKCNRLIYYILGKGKNRKSDHKLRKVSRTDFNAKLAETKQFEEWAAKKRQREAEKKKEGEDNHN